MVSAVNPGAMKMGALTFGAVASHAIVGA